MIAIFEIEDWEEQLVRSIFPNQNLMFFRDALKPEHIPTIKECDVLVVFIYSRVSRDVINQLPNLKLIATMSTGFDHIDLAACKERGITVSNVPTYGDHTVAQHTFALLLALTRKLVQSVEQVKRGDFSPRKELRGTDVHRKTIGVVGTGKIGMNVIRIARGFDMDVIAYDPFPNEAMASVMNFTYAPLDDLFAKSDIVTVHVPLMPATKHLINKESIAKMKQGVIILNTARGGIIDTQALYEGLVTGKVGGAGLDVVEEEGAVKEEKQLLSPQFQADYKTIVMNHLLVQHPNVLVTPHNAFNSAEALERIIRTTIGNVAAWQSGKPMHIVH